MSDASSLRVLTAAALAGALLAAAGCGGDKDRQEGPPRPALVPGQVQPADTAAVDTVVADTTAAPAASVPATLSPAPSTTPRREPPRAVDPARQAAPGGPFSLQLGSFRSLDNARALARRVEALGYAPALESAVVGGQTYHRVLLRGLKDRAEASRTGERLRSELDITYLIRQSD